MLFRYEVWLLWIALSRLEFSSFPLPEPLSDSVCDRRSATFTFLKTFSLAHRLMDLVSKYCFSALPRGFTIEYPNSAASPFRLGIACVMSNTSTAGYPSAHIFDSMYALNNFVR